MEIDLLKKHWEAFSREDPLWAVLTDSSRVGGRWDIDEFLATGEHEVVGYLDELEQLGAAPARGRALDFGCGVGRLTQALAERFDRCDGVDIAEPMVAEARRINRRAERVRYHVNDAPNLELFAGESFDFVLSFIVLQHMEPRYAKGYITEFVRVLKRGGVALFQVPAGMRTPPPAPLPDGAYRASIAVVGSPPRQLSCVRRRSCRYACATTARMPGRSARASDWETTGPTHAVSPSRWTTGAARPTSRCPRARR